MLPARRMSTDPAAPASNVPAGFAYRVRKDGDVEVTHHGRPAATLRGKAASAFVAAVARGDDAAAQQLMARVTGNYKRGNERLAGRHARRNGVG